MKKVILSTTAIILLASLFLSCAKKDKPETVSQKLQHNWTIINEIDNSHDASGDHIETMTAITGDYINFSSTGTVTSQFRGLPGSATYSLINDTQILINGRTSTIKTLTDTQLVFYDKEEISA